MYLLSLGRAGSKAPFQYYKSFFLCIGLTHCDRDKLAANFLTTWHFQRHFGIFFDKNIQISIESLLKFVSKGPINNIRTLVQIMAWRQPGDKPMMRSLLTHNGNMEYYIKCRDKLAANFLTTWHFQRHFGIFFDKNIQISIENLLKFVSKGPINNIRTLVQIMAWRQPGDKPMMRSLLTHNGNMEYYIPPPPPPPPPHTHTHTHTHTPICILSSQPIAVICTNVGFFMLCNSLNPQ